MRFRIAFVIAAILCEIAAAQAPVSPEVAQAVARSSPSAVLCVRDEGECLKKLQGFAARDGNILSLRLENGETRIFETTQQACDDAIFEKCLHFRLAGYFPAQRHFLIHIGFLFHGGEFHIVSARSGATADMPTVPHYSPAGVRLASVCASEADDHAENGIDIWSASEPPMLEFRHRPQEYALYEFERWDGDDRVVMRVTIRTENDFKTLPASLELKDGQWELVSPIFVQR